MLDRRELFVDRRGDIVSHARFIGMVLAAIAGAIFLGNALFTVGADAVSSQSNLAVALGVFICAMVVVGGVLGIAWLFRSVSRHFGLFAVVLLLLPLFGCSKVPPGFVGIRVKMYGHQRGVQDLPIVTGRVWYNPWTEEIEIFPTFLQTVSWTQNTNEGRPVDESITFNSREVATINADISVSYQFEAAKVPEIFLKFRQPAEVITDTYIRSRVRDAFVREASTMGIMELAGAQKGVLLTRVKKDLDDELGPQGIHFEYVSFIGDLRVPPQVREAINAAIETTQRAAQAQNRVAQTEAEARQQVAAAEGAAKSKVITAQADADAMREQARGDADALLMRKKAEAEGNKMIAESMTPTLIQYLALEKWQGTVPQYSGSQLPIPFIQVGPASK